MIVTTELNNPRAGLGARFKDKYFLAALSITVAGFILRLFRLNYIGLSGDEPITVAIAQLNAADVIQASGNTGYPPLHYLLIHYWMELFGKSELSIRIPSLIAGTVLVAVIIMVGTHMFNERVALLAGGLAATSPMLLHFSQEARVYSFLALAALVSTWALWYAVQSKHWIAWALYSVTAIILLYMQYAVIFLFAAHGLFCLLQARRKPMILLRFILSMVAMLIAFIPWLPHFLAGPRSVGLTLGFSIESYWSVIVSFTNGETIAGLGIRDMLAGISGLILLAIAVWAFFYRGKPLPAQLLAATLAVPFLLLLPISGYFSMPRHFSYLLPMFLLLIAWGITSLPFWKLQTALLAGVAVLLIISLPRFYAGQRITVQHWREFIEELPTSNKETLILIAPSFYKSQFDYYYHGQVPILPLPGLSDPRTDGDSQNKITHDKLNQFNALLTNYRHIILTGAQRAAVDPNHDIETWLKSRGWTRLPQTKLTQEYPGLEVEEFSR